jgi:hypothetical protein
MEQRMLAVRKEMAATTDPARRAALEQMLQQFQDQTSVAQAPPMVPSWGTPDQLWGTTIGGGPVPDMSGANAPIGINVQVNNADADDIAQTIIDRLHSAGY